MTGLLPTAMREALDKRLGEKPTVVVADPYLAHALRTETGYDGFTDIYTWAVERCGTHKPNPIDLFWAYKAGLKAIGLPYARQALPEYNPAEVWDAAQRLGRDWEEVLRGVSSLQEAQTFWQNLAAHRLIQKTFELYEKEEPPLWLKALPFPYRSPKHTRTFWERLKDFLAAYQRYLHRKKLTFSEEALHRLRAIEQTYEGVIFLHIYGLYPAVAGFLKHAVTCGAEIWSWDVQPLKATLSDIWGSYDTHAQTFSFPHRRRSVSLYLRATLLEVIEAAAQKIANYLQRRPDARIAVWCEGEAAALLRYFLEQAGLGPLLSPASLTLAEATQTGRQLISYISAGMAGQLSEWPPLEGDFSDPAERWTKALYKIVQQYKSPQSSEAWRFLLRLLQSEAPQDRISFSPDTRVYIGRLTQLAGGCYDAVFLVESPAEPLGRWMRPSFWLASLRRKFSPPEWHQQTAWRLISLLLWGSGEVHLFRRSGHEYLSPLEEFLRNSDLFDAQNDFAPPEEAPPPVINPAPPQPLLYDGMPSQRLLSPSLVGQFIVCPRRAYWAQILTERPPNQAAAVGQILHEVVARSFPSRKISLRRLAHKFSRRRTFYRLTSRKSNHRSGWQRAYRLLRPLIAEVGQPILKTLLDLLNPASSSLSGKRIRWRHLCAHPPVHCKFISESWISHPTLPLAGRMDLVVEVDTINPDTGETLTRRILLDFKSSVYKEPSKLPKVVAAACEGIEQLTLQQGYRTPKDFRDVVFQLALYAWMLAEQGKPIDKAALISLWWRPSGFLPLQASKPSGHAPAHDTRLPYEAYEGVEISLLSESLANLIVLIDAYLKKATAQENFPMTKERSHCTYCDFALLCDRLA